MDRFFTRIVLSDRLSYRIGRHVAFWIACGLFMGFLYSFHYYYNPRMQGYPLLSYVESFLFLPQHIFLSYAILYFVLPRFILKGKYWYGLFSIALLIVIAALCSPLSNYLLINPYRRSIGCPVSHLTIPQSFMGGLRGSTTVAGFAAAIKLIKYWYLKNIENQRLEKEKLAAELQLLKGQIHPHFMFNTLNSIYSMALKQSAQTADSILKLSQLMRYILTECNGPVVLLSKEVEILQHYIELEKGRFQERLDMTVNIQGNLRQNIAPLLLLPFLENSFKHGASEMIDQAWISLDLLVQEDTLKFKLINGRDPNAANHPYSGNIGLQNVKKRLQLIYPNAHELRITEDDDTFVVSLTLKLEPVDLADLANPVEA
jgi:sensor histidine kinase YesM